MVLHDFFGVKVDDLYDDLFDLPTYSLQDIPKIKSVVEET